MQVRNNYLDRIFVKYVTEEFSIKEAKQFLQETGFRCVPILDKTEKRFLGNVYEIDIFKYEGSLDDSVLNIADNVDAIVHEDEPFFRVFFTIKKLPFLAVVNSEGEFAGILTHSKVMEIFEDALGVHTKGHMLTIGVYDFDNTLKKLTAIISKHTSIQSLITLHSDKFVRQIVITLPKDIQQSILEKIHEELTKANFRIVHTDQFS
ncbi:cyclic di-AMP binding protein CbpA [Pallidibacillus pasinlerensis]|uniref:CBS domain-containing protein n=1 Tax=Pallidibacillus pasinlerensis TaxID=2703818 RepID=A0ABX0A774_9BACI|nr:cyclic di-AMP binding protein CbpA [Pallidibacillus pasinlerensis]NCU18396.1 CBS domain-containing protein [Pallidibacillus pasinlerensis]